MNAGWSPDEAGFYGDVGVELPRITLGESVASVGDEAF